MDGKFFYDKVLGIIDYHGDIQAGSSVFHDDFSPNNIRRLYISPDGAVVEYHIAVKGKGKGGKVSFPSGFCDRVYAMEDFTPMVQTLANHIVSSLEELVMCTGSVNGGYLDQRELELEALLRGYKGGDGDIKASVQKRFKRLSAVIIYDGTLDSFLKSIEKPDPLVLLKDTEFVKSSCQITDFNNPEWYTFYGSLAKHYALDRDGGALNTHFKKVRKDMEARIRDGKKDAFLQKDVADIVEKVKSKLAICATMVSYCQALRKNFPEVFNKDVLIVQCNTVECSFLNKLNEKGTLPAFVNMNAHLDISERRKLNDVLQALQKYPKSLLKRFYNAYFNYIATLPEYTRKGIAVKYGADKQLWSGKDYKDGGKKGVDEDNRPYYISGISKASLPHIENMFQDTTDIRLAMRSMTEVMSLVYSAEGYKGFDVNSIKRYRKEDFNV